MEAAVHLLAEGIELVGIGVMVIGALVATAVFLRRLARGNPFGHAYHGYRSDLGRGILLGLEFLVVGDIIGTVAVDPTLPNLAVLGVIVLIRTFLSFSLEVEINGHWPWEGSRQRDQGRSDRF